MTVTIAWWDLTASDATIDALEQDARSSVEAWCRVEGLRVKLWLADRENGRWGAVMWWGADVPPEQPVPPNRAVELIGRPPTFRAQFEVAATAEESLVNPDHRQSRPSRAE